MPAVPGRDVTDVLAAIVAREPDWDRLPSDLSPRVGNLLRRCLRKDPRIDCGTSATRGSDR